MASILTNSVLIFAIRCVDSSLAPPGFKDDPEATIRAFTRLQAGLYQIDFTRTVDVSEVSIDYNPAGFDANPPNFNAPPVMLPSLIGTSPNVTGMIVAIGQVGIGLGDHDFEVVMKRIRIQA